MMARGIARLLLITLSMAFLLVAPRQIRAQTSGDFPVADEIGIALFGNPYEGGVEPILFSANGEMVAVHTERGLGKGNRAQDEVRIYDVKALASFANASGGSQPPKPRFSIIQSTYKEGLIISRMRWLRDSSVLAFNVLNHPSFRAITTALTSGAALFGLVTGTTNNQLSDLSALYVVGGPRSLQLTMRLAF